MKSLPQNVRINYRMYNRYYNIILIKRMMNILKCSFEECLKKVLKYSTKFSVKNNAQYICDFFEVQVPEIDYSSIEFKNRREIKVFKIKSGKDVKDEKEEKVKPQKNVKIFENIEELKFVDLNILKNSSNTYEEILLEYNKLENKLPLTKSFMFNLIKEFLDENEIKYNFDNIESTEGTNCKDSTNSTEVSFNLYENKVGIDLVHFTYFLDSNTIKPHKKFKELSKNNYRYIGVFDNHLQNTNKYNVLKNIILHACKKSQTRIYARDCKVVVKDAILMKDFFEENNIQGYRNAQTAFVLECSGIPVMCYTIGHAHFGKGKYDAEIARGACRLGYSIVGGASKLWKYIIENTEYNSIVYYTDNNQYNGNSMEFLENIEFIDSKPGFWNYWVEYNRLKNREPKRHSEIMKLIKEQKIIEVPNAGVSVHVWKRNK